MPATSAGFHTHSRPGVSYRTSTYRIHASSQAWLNLHARLTRARTRCSTRQYSQNNSGGIWGCARRRKRRSRWVSRLTGVLEIETIIICTLFIVVCVHYTRVKRTEIGSHESLILIELMLTIQVNISHRHVSASRQYASPGHYESCSDLLMLPQFHQLSIFQRRKRKF
jgi:hypothetical protein